MKPILRRAAEWLSAAYLDNPVACSTLAAGVLLAAIYSLDFAAGHPPGMSFLYVIPIWVASRLGDFRSGVAATVVTTLILARVDYNNHILNAGEIVANALLKAGALLFLNFIIWRAEQGRRSAEHSARHDALTGMLNRQAIEPMASYAIERSLRHREPLAVAMIDCDGFKATNDEFGHAHGDRILQMLASKLLHGVGHDGLVARTGGDEFLVLFENRSDWQAETILEQIRESFHDLTERHGAAMSFTFGVSRLGPGGHTLSELAMNADRDMYRRKRRAKLRAQHALVKL
jgi:diguanylate cyclase (GGDEF)-like protein